MPYSDTVRRAVCAPLGLPAKAPASRRPAPRLLTSTHCSPQSSYRKLQRPFCSLILVLFSLIFR